MNEKVDQTIKECPILFRHGGYPEVGPGWLDIVYKVSLVVEKEMLSWSLLSLLMNDLIREEYPYYSQIKEKFGRLCLYVSHTSPVLDALFTAAERKSVTVCEDCGKPGEIRNTGWVRTLCDTCLDSWLRKRSKLNIRLEDDM